MEARIVAVYESKYGGEFHTIRQVGKGELFCDCRAAHFEKDCWAIIKERGNQDYQRMMEAFNKQRMEGRTLPDKEELIQQQIDYCSKREAEFRALSHGIPTPPAIWQPEYREWARLAVQRLRLHESDIKLGT